jgi:hypothetical protein
MGELKETVINMSPAEIARLRGKRQNLSSRDKQLFLNKIDEIETFAKNIGKEIVLKNI